MEEQTIFGSLHRDVPLRIRRSASDTPISLLCQAKQQVEQGIMLSDFPFTFRELDELSQISSPYLRLMILSTEVASAVGNHDFELVNLYGQTEGPTVCMYFFKGPKNVEGLI